MHGKLKLHRTIHQVWFIQIYSSTSLSSHSLDDANLWRKKKTNYTLFIDRVRRAAPASSGISGSFECIIDIQTNLILHHVHRLKFLKATIWFNLNNTNNLKTHLVCNIQRIVIWCETDVRLLLTIRPGHRSENTGKMTQ